MGIFPAYRRKNKPFMKVSPARHQKFDWSFPVRLWRLRHRLGTSWEGRLALVLTFAGILAGMATYAALNSLPPFGTNADMVIWLLNIDLIILLVLGVLVARRVASLFGIWRRGIPGSQIQMRFVYIFGLVAMAPAVIMTIFSLFFFHYGVQAWFSDRVKTAVQESRVVAESYLREHHQIIRADILAMANDLNRESEKFYSDPAGFERYVRTQSVVRNLPEVFLFDATNKVIMQTRFADDFQLSDIPSFAREAANKGEVMILTDINDDRVRALIKLQNLPNTYLFVGRPVEANVLNHLSATRQAVQKYEEVAARYSGLRLTVTMIYGVVALVLLLASMWFGLTFARRFASPISDLIEVSDKVRKGDLTAKVSEKSGLEEFDYLARAFNKMTAQILSQQEDLLEANVQLDQRRKFTETVLAGVTSGILGITRNGQITICNTSAADFLKKPADSLIGESIYEILPEARDFLDQSYLKPNRTHNFECPYILGDGSRRVFLIRVAIELIDGQDHGAVVTFDDITDLQSAQRKAAWADVARRIAHEIKNPLTPIQLSAERLKRKYLKSVPAEDQGIFEQCIDTIIRHVGDIGHMVTEFSSFARMPEPVMKETDIGKLVQEIVTMNREAAQGVGVQIFLDDSDKKLICDARQVRQAFTNILKNAMDSVEEKEKAEDGGYRGAVAVGLGRTADDSLILIVSDNGLGLPKDRDPQSLTEPYVTLREKGTGLGLAIVKKIMEDHGGHIIFGRPESVSFKDWPVLNGATVCLVFPRAQDQVHEIMSSNAA